MHPRQERKAPRQDVGVDGEEPAERQGAQFRSAGGPYLYARQAFGPFVGLQVGWITWLMRVSAAGDRLAVLLSARRTIQALARGPSG